MSEEKLNTETLPENYDPYDMDLKKQFHPKADEKNMIGIPRKHPLLLCGAKRKGKICKHVAGFGTDHPGYGRCKFHGGNNTGPQKPESKSKVSQNAVKHGLYSKGLLEDEKTIYQELLSSSDLVNLKEEIAFLKTKILSYIARWSLKQQGAGYEGTKQWYKDGTETAFYHAGSIEDKPLMRAFDQLGRLVEKQARITGENKDDLLASINQELRAASSGQVSLSWGGEAQKREQKE